MSSSIAATGAAGVRGLVPSRVPSLAPGLALNLVLGLASGGCVGGTPHDLHVTSYAPRGPIDQPGPIEITFDQPVVAEAMVGEPAEPRAVVFTPAIAWQGTWQDRRTLVIEPLTPLAPSTRYHVALSGELANRTAGFRFAFVHRPLAVEGVWGVAVDALAPGAALPVSFNQLVRPADATAHCKLVADKSEIALGARDVEPATTIALVPATPLVPELTYTLTCAELGGAGGDAVLDKPYTLAVRARPALRVAALAPAGDDVPADQITIELAFSSPASLDAVRKAISSVPAIPDLDRGTLTDDGKGYRATVDLEARTTYRVTVAGLVDTFGEALAAPTHHEFRTGGALPRLAMPRDRVALEAGTQGYPLWSRNVGHIAIACAAIPKAKLARLLATAGATAGNDEPWGPRDADAPLDWAKLGLTARTTTRTTARRDRWVLNELDLGAICARHSGRRGVYLVEASEASASDADPDPRHSELPQRHRVLANVTDLGVMIEIVASSDLVWVTSRSSGAPIAGARVTVFTPGGRQVWTDLTDDDGILKLPSSALGEVPMPLDEAPRTARSPDGIGRQRLIAIVEHAGDLAIVDDTGPPGSQAWNASVPGVPGVPSVPGVPAGNVPAIRGFLQTDRGLYHPGEVVHVKGLAREVAQGLLPRVPGAGVAIAVTDSRGQVAMATETQLSRFGGFTFDLALPADASRGDYDVAAAVNGQAFHEHFAVEDLRPPAFGLTLESAAEHPRPGDRLMFELDARTSSGAPVAHAKVEWRLRKRRHPVRFDGWDEYTFSASPRSPEWDERRDGAGELVSDGAGQTDARGHLVIATRDDATAFDGPVDYLLSASVTDATDRTASASVVVPANQTAFYLGLYTGELVQAAGVPFGVSLVALDPDGKQVATRVHLSLVRTVTTCTWSTTGPRRDAQCSAHDQTALARDLELAASGPHTEPRTEPRTEPLTPAEPGAYTLTAEATDAGGHKVMVTRALWVTGPGEVRWRGDEDDHMPLIANKLAYRPGETARLVAWTSLPRPTALVTIERDGILDAHVQRMTSASEALELAIPEAWAPNVFARVAMVTGRQGAGDHVPSFQTGLVELVVASTPRQLDVAITLDQDEVRPGDRVTGKITVRHAGAPVVAEVSLVAADAGPLITPSATPSPPDPMRAFYAPYRLGVTARTNGSRLTQPAELDVSALAPGGDPARAWDEHRVRTTRAAPALWAPMLVTDARGEIAFSFTAPDTLTALRLTAIAADTGARFGTTERRLRVAITGSRSSIRASQNARSRSTSGGSASAPG